MFELLLKEPPAVWREADWSFASGWSGAALAAAIALAALVVAISLWRAPLSPGRRVALGALQLVAAAVALTMLWRPALELERTREGENAIAWLVDNSASMTVADEEGGATRREALLAALETPGLLGDNRFVDRVVAVGTAGELVERLDGVEDLPRPSPRSAVAAALETQLADVGDTALAAVVLLSDGADNVGGADARWWQRLATAGVPVHTVGVGRPDAAGDVELASVNLPESAAVGTAVRARVRITHDVLDGEGETVRLRVSHGDSLLLAEDVALVAGGDETLHTVALDAGEAGLKRLDFSIEAMPGERERRNNRQARVIDVRDAPRRILYVEGEPRWEYKFLRRAVHDHGGIEVVSLLRTSPNKFYRQGVRDARELADGFPRTREALFAYEAVIIGSLPAAELDAAQQAALRDFVNLRGGSLLMIGGRQGLADGGWARSGVAQALPVSLDARLDARTYRRERIRVLPTRQGRRAEWLRLADEEADDARVWASLPEIADRQGLGSPKPGARVLLADTDGEPVLVAQRYGRGTSVVLGTGGTWRWQMGLPASDESHERFWRALLGELVARSPSRLAIATDGPVIRDGEETAVTVDALAADYTPLEAPSLVATVTTPTGATRRVELAADPARAGRYLGTVALDADGPWGIGVATPPEGESPSAPAVTTERWLVRESNTAEAFGARQRRDFLERVAAVSGGRHFPLADIDELPAALESENAALTRAELLPLWNMPLLFLLLFGAKGVEWLLRLRWKRL